MPTDSTDPVVRAYFALADALRADPVLKEEISPGNWLLYDGKGLVPPRIQQLQTGGKGSALATEFPYAWLRLGNSDSTLGNRTQTFGRECFTEIDTEHFLLTVVYDDLRVESSLPIETAIRRVLKWAWRTRLGLPGIVGNVERVNKRIEETARKPEAQGSFRRIANWDIPVTIVDNQT